jgi:hypothetical protein
MVMVEQSIHLVQSSDVFQGKEIELLYQGAEAFNA